MGEWPLSSEGSPSASRETQVYDSEFRLDPLTERWVLVAEGRNERPSDLENNGSNCASVAPRDGTACFKCAFCPGNENLTTPTVAAVLLPESHSQGDFPDDFIVTTCDDCNDVQGAYWRVRAFENKYPAFRVSEHVVDATDFCQLRRRFRSGVLPVSERFFQKFEANGRHEVVVDSRRHIRGWGEATELEVCLVFRLFQSRLREFRASGRFAHAFFFKNVGVGAGASQPHSHCQVVASTLIPDDVRFQLERVAHYEENRRNVGELESYWEALLRAEMEDGRRVVAASDSFVLYCPYASRFPGQLEICPRFDKAFEDYDDGILDALALTARNAILALQKVYEKISSSESALLDYNVVMTNAPYCVDPKLEDAVCVFRPRLTIIPSLVKKAGYEYGSGIDINPVSPETAASWLREYWVNS